MLPDSSKKNHQKIKQKIDNLSQDSILKVKKRNKFLYFIIFFINFYLLFCSI